MQTIQSFKFKSPKLIYSPVWFVCWADSALWLPVNQALCKRSIHDPWFWVSECERNSNLQISISTQQLRSSCSSGQQADEPQPWPSLHKGLNGSVAHTSPARHIQRHELRKDPWALQQLLHQTVSIHYQPVIGDVQVPQRLQLGEH